MKLAKPCVECSETRLIHGRGLCERCYRRIQYHGQLGKYQLPKKSPEQWWDLIDKEDPDTCWQWPGYCRPNGYGHTGSLSAHVWSYRRANGLTPEGGAISIDHTCHNRDASCVGGWECKHRSCVNPRHLEAVPQRVNLQRAARRLKHCKRGHELTPENLVGKGQRCKTCHKARRKSEYARIKAAREGTTTP